MTATRPAVTRHTGARVDATARVVAAFGVLAALAGLEHGVGEILQGPVRPTGLGIESWPDPRVRDPRG